MPRLYPPYFLRISGGDAPDALVFTQSGMVAGTGINEHGLSLCWNTLKASDRGVGVPATFVVRRALQARDLSEMVGLVIGAQRANGMNFVLADPDQAVDVEMSATRYNLSYCYGILSHANHYEAPELLQYEMDMPLTVPDTLLRSPRMRSLLEDRRGRAQSRRAAARGADRPRRRPRVDLPPRVPWVRDDRVDDVLPERTQGVGDRRQPLHLRVRRDGRLRSGSSRRRPGRGRRRLTVARAEASSRIRKND